MPHTILLNCYSTCPIQISLAYWIIAATSSFTLVPLSGWTIWAAQILFFYFFYYFFWDDSGNKICYIQNICIYTGSIISIQYARTKNLWKCDFNSAKGKYISRQRHTCLHQKQEMAGRNELPCLFQAHCWLDV